MTKAPHAAMVLQLSRVPPLRNPQELQYIFYLMILVAKGPKQNTETNPLKSKPQLQQQLPQSCAGGVEVPGCRLCATGVEDECRAGQCPKSLKWCPGLGAQGDLTIKPTEHLRTLTNDGQAFRELLEKSLNVRLSTLWRPGVRH